MNEENLAQKYAHTTQHFRVGVFLFGSRTRSLCVLSRVETFELIDPEAAGGRRQQKTMIIYRV